MTKLKIHTDGNGHPIDISTSFTGRKLLNTALLNKGTAFSERERHQFGLHGLLPVCEETLDEQAKRLYRQYQRQSTPLQKNVFLKRLHDENMVLFYRLASDHLSEMLPIIYTPTVGEAVQSFSHQFSHPRGIYIAYPHRERIKEIFANYADRDVRLVVLSDGEGVLGIGDQGIGSMEICMAKIAVYTLCGGINPYVTLPLQIDAGTHNTELLEDPAYLGWRHPRITGKPYDAFINEIIQTLHQLFPQSFLHWEDFGRDNANRLLKHYQHQRCCFNDDIQGTGAVTAAAILSATRRHGCALKDQRLIVFGAGSAGMGIVEQLCLLMEQEGLSPQEARERFWLLDRPGLLTQAHLEQLTPAQRPFARQESHWPKGTISLQQTIEAVRPTVLIGCSACKGAFDEACIRAMAAHCEHPIILALSNPPERNEANPTDVLAWSQGRARIATGSPVPPATYQGQSIDIAQCNNALIYPGIGLGCMVAKASRVTPHMLNQACEALADFAGRWQQQQHSQALLPPLDQAPEASRHVARAVAKAALSEGVSQLNTTQQSNLDVLVDAQFWTPAYLPFKKRMF